MPPGVRSRSIVELKARANSLREHKSFCNSVNTNQENLARLAWKHDDRYLKGIDIQNHSIRQI